MLIFNKETEEYDVEIVDMEYAITEIGEDKINVIVGEVEETVVLGTLVTGSQFIIHAGLCKCASSIPIFGQYTDKIIIVVIVVKPDGSSTMTVKEIEVE